MQNGLSKRDFFHYTPREIEIFLEGIASQKKVEAKKSEYVAWVHGYYVKLAVLAALNGRKSRYPQQPLGEDNNQNIGNSGYIVATEAMCEEDKERTRTLFLENLQEMQRNFKGRG